MSTGRAVALHLYGCLFLAAACAGEAPKAAPEKEFSIQESDLQRLPVSRMSTFPWAGKAAQPKPNEGKTPPPNPANNMLDVSSGDVTIAASGPFSRITEQRKGEKGADEEKEVLTLQKDVEISQAATGSLLRGQHIKVVRDTASGDVERLDANGTVEIVFGERKARGETLTYETKFGPPFKTPAGTLPNVLVDRIIVGGDVKARKPATLWSGGDVIQSQRFVMDRRRDTFLAIGGTRAEVGLPAHPGSEPVSTETEKNAMFPGLSLKPGAKIFLSCDGDFNYEGFSGRITLKRNVQAQQEGFLLVADEMEIKLDLDPAGQAQAGAFAGSPRSLACKGRIEIKTQSQVIHCDQLNYDLVAEHLRLEMNNPKEDVKIYTRNATSPDNATQVVQILRCIDIDTKTMNMADTDPNSPPTRRQIKNFTGPIPNPRPSYKTDR